MFWISNLSNSKPNSKPCQAQCPPAWRPWPVLPHPGFPAPKTFVLPKYAPTCALPKAGAKTNRAPDHSKQIYIYIYIYIHTHTYTYIYHIYIYIHTYMHTSNTTTRSKRNQAFKKREDAPTGTTWLTCISIITYSVLVLVLLLT